MQLNFAAHHSTKPLKVKNGTNCRSRRRSVTRILNPSIQTKRQKCISEFEDDSNEDNFPTLVASPDTSDHHPNPDNLHNIDPPDYAPSPIHNVDVTTVTPTSQSNQLCTTSSGCHTFTPAEICSFELMDLLDNVGCPLNTY